MMIVDSSVWIDYFRGNESKQTLVLDATLGLRLVAIGDLILTEVLQGFRREKDYRIAKAVFEHVAVFEMLGKERAIQSAENFRQLRKKGITVRKTADVIIASFCISRDFPLLFSDKDFRPFVQHLGLIEA